VEQGLPDPPEGIVDTMRGAVAAVSRAVDARLPLVALGEQPPVVGVELPDAPTQRVPPVVQFVLGHLRVGLDEQEGDFRRQVEPLAGTATDEVRDLPAGDPARPGEEVAAPVELPELVPEDQRGLLVQVVGVIDVRDEGVNVSVEPGLDTGQVSGELRLPVLDVVTRHHSPRSEPLPPSTPYRPGGEPG